jgi:hypothetical protein
VQRPSIVRWSAWRALSQPCLAPVRPGNRFSRSAPETLGAGPSSLAAILRIVHGRPSNEDVSRVQAWTDDEFGPFAEAWTARWNELSSELPRCLYHYTTADGIVGIVEAQTIWATDARYLNDTSELSYANDVVQDVARELLERGVGDVAATFLEAASLRLLDSLTTMLDVFVACFCEDGDLLSQWRGYASTNGGYALGFDPGVMRHKTGLALRRVAYDKADQRALVRQPLQFFVDWLSQPEEDAAVNEFRVQTALTEVLYVLSDCLFCFKHPSFREEREWRLVRTTLRDESAEPWPLRWRSSPSGLIPYVELRPNGESPGVSGLLPITEAVVGPHAHPELAKHAFRRLVMGHGLDPAIRGSAIPLRV